MQIRFYGVLRDVTATNRLTLPAEDGETVRRLLERLAERYPALGTHFFTTWTGAGPTRTQGPSVHPHLLVARNGVDVRSLLGPDEPLEQDDTVAIFPPSAGG